MCQTCQVCEHPNWSLQGPIGMTTIPERAMSSVCLDIFHLPLTTYRGVEYDSLIVCVDRLSGWIIAKPTLNKGLTAEKTARLLLEWWETFGIPTIITCDQGPQFTGQWFKTMCARLGIQVAYSQAYRPQANGRAEAAGKSIKNLLRKFWVENPGTNWVEILPRLLYAYHNNINKSGLSPYQILFGRERTGPGLPLVPPRECEDATQFLARMENLDKKISTEMNERNKKIMEWLNQNKNTRNPYKPGDLVWYLRPKHGASTNLDTWWVGPCKITEVSGDNSYQILIKSGETQMVHRDQLKTHVPDIISGKPTSLFSFKGGYRPMGISTGEGWIEEIFNHRKNAQGELEFLLRWKGNPPSEDSWEPESVLHDCVSIVLKEYCIQNMLSYPRGQDSEPEAS